MKAYNKKTFNDLCIQDKIIEETKIVKLNNDLVHKYQALKVIESLVKDQLNDLKQEIIDNPKHQEFFEISFSKVKGKHIFRKAYTKTFIKVKKQYQ